MPLSRKLFLKVAVGGHLMECFYLTFDCFYFHQLRQFRRASKAHAHHMSEEEKKKRKKSLKKVTAGPNLSRTFLLAASLSIAGAFLRYSRRKEIIFLSFLLLFPISSINAYSGSLATRLFHKEVALLSRLSGSSFFFFPFFSFFCSFPSHFLP